MKQGEGVRQRDVAEWLSDAVADAERRGLPQLKPLLEGLAQSTSALRNADWEAPAEGHALRMHDGKPHAAK